MIKCPECGRQLDLEAEWIPKKVTVSLSGVGRSFKGPFFVQANKRDEMHPVLAIYGHTTDEGREIYTAIYTGRTGSSFVINELMAYDPDTSRSKYDYYTPSTFYNRRDVDRTLYEQKTIGELLYLDRDGMNKALDRAFPTSYSWSKASSGKPSCESSIGKKPVAKGTKAKAASSSKSSSKKGGSKGRKR